MCKCKYCQNNCPNSQNYCSFQCMVDEAKDNGCKIHCPNGLPIGCLMADGTMLECEHGDHPDYKFPVHAIWIGEEEEDPILTQFNDERHALLYCDEFIALTLGEARYALWHLSSGRALTKSHENLQLSDESLEKIRKHYNDQRGC